MHFYSKGSRLERVAIAQKLWKNFDPPAKLFPDALPFPGCEALLSALPSKPKQQNKTTRASLDLASRFRIKSLLPSSHDVAIQIV